MTAKQYLNQMYRLNDLILSTKEELNKLDLLIGEVSALKMSGLPSGNDKTATFAKTVERMDNLKSTMLNEISNYVTVEEEVRGIINSVDNVDERLLLRYRYILFDSWDKIAEKLNYSDRQVHRLHSQALQRVDLKRRQ